MNKPKTERNNKIVELRNSGMKYRELAAIMGLSKSAVAAIYYREMDRTNGWARLRNEQIY